MEDSNSDLCAQCAVIDFDKIFSIDWDAQKPKQWVRVCEIKLQNNAPCKLCQFFRRVTPTIEQRPASADFGAQEEQKLFLCVFRDYARSGCFYRFPKASYLKLKDGHLVDEAWPKGGLLGLVWDVDLGAPDSPSNHDEWAVSRSLERSGFICPLGWPSDVDPLFRTRVIDPSQIDYELIKTWYQTCKQNCRGDCDKISERRPPHWLLDCRSRKLVRAEPAAAFLALSYVWGSSSGNGPGQEIANRGQNFPLVIEDAIAVTLALEFQYLWIDRLCVPRDNDEELQVELRNMAYIYEAAEITIIAAAGEDASHGLPGVSTTSRPSQPQARVGKHELISPGAFPQHLIDKSKWKTRGWTYQEAIMSRRKLYFTAEQIYLECNGSQAWETLGLMKREIGQIGDRQFLYAHGPSGWTDIWKVSQRDLTYPSDSLNTVLGLLEMRGEKYSYPLAHIQGIPFSYRDNVTLSEDFAAELCWHFEYQQPPVARNLAHPSWSWAGWTRAEVWIPWASVPKKDLQMWVSSRSNGNLLNLESLQDGSADCQSLLQAAQGTLSTSITILLLKTQSMTIEPLHDVWADGNWWTHFRFDLSVKPGPSNATKNATSYFIPESGGKWRENLATQSGLVQFKALLVDGHDDIQVSHLLIVANVGVPADTWERIGICIDINVPESLDCSDRWEGELQDLAWTWETIKLG